MDAGYFRVSAWIHLLLMASGVTAMVFIEFTVYRATVTILAMNAALFALGACMRSEEIDRLKKRLRE